MRIKVQGTNFVKDTNTGALLMTSKNAIIENEARKKLLQRAQSKDEEINKLKEKMGNISSDIAELKAMLQSLSKQSKQ
jgi:uncharacterized membrane protein